MKTYEKPTVEIVELVIEGTILAASSDSRFSEPSDVVYGGSVFN